eukprot:CAMPEP_0178439208 /NCGR_PEP_ID=MMETSP0689_2-20121128/36030_1 /TAXON_ID=160604 /ORGANISM="Amphidinium massartii, Strain CS-259" /LENGTH=50 /DNA_ID=CAMNT_0020061715 /DNA_START=729 /DNA_END=882 /DNA_ORIENTATION=+
MPDATMPHANDCCGNLGARLNSLRRAEKLAFEAPVTQGQAWLPAHALRME